nr:hypothetical protein [Tanacetum cinerariifolium]
MNGDAPAAIASVSGDAEAAIPPKTTKQNIARRNELKAKIILLLAIPDEHLLKFHRIKNAKTLWEAIKTRFQKLISQLEIHGEVISQEDANLKLLRSLLPAWNTYTLIMQNKSDLDTLSMDDLYNNLKWVAMLTMRVNRFIKETERNMNFNGKETVSFHKTTVECYNCHKRRHFARECREPRNQGNKNGDNTRRVVPVETLANALVVTDGMGYDWSYQAKEGPTDFALMAHSSSGSSSLDIKNEAVFEEGVAFLKYDVKVRDNSITELKNQLEESLKEKDDLKLKLEKFETSSKNLTNLINSQISPKDKTGLGYDSQLNERYLNNKSDVFESASDSSVNESEEDNSQANDRYKAGEGYHAVPLPYTGNFMPPRPDLSFAGLDDSVFKSRMSEIVTSVHETETSASKTTKKSIEKPKTVRSSAPLIEEWESDSNDDCVIRPLIKQNKPSYAKINFVKSDENIRKFVIEQHAYRQDENRRKRKSMFKKGGKATSQREVRPVWNNAQRVNHQNLSNNLTHPHSKRNCIPTAVATKSRQVPVNTAKQSSPRAATSISTARHVNTVVHKPKMNDALPINYSYFQAHSSIKRPNKKRTAVTDINFNKNVSTAKVNNVTTGGPKAVASTAEGNRENAVKSSTCLIWIPKGNVIDHISKDSGSYMLKRFNYVDLQGILKIKGFLIVDALGISHEISPSLQIIKRLVVDLLHLEKVLKEELKFKLFSVSQMCDKKNSVLFTETEYLVLSPDIKLLDENQVLLKVPRQNNMYSFDLKNVVPSGGIKREFSVARTPQQNGVAKRKNRTLIEAARTMLADSLLPTTFWAETINTACYVQNRVLVTKPHNKKPYELLVGRSPNLDFMRPFGYPGTILNTLDHLGKFEGNADEGFLVGYFVNSKAFRVFNTRIRKVEENLHIKFLENKSNVARSGPEWLFDIDSLTKFMNYEPITVGNQTNDDAGIVINVNAWQAGQEKESNHEYILLPFMPFNSPLSLSTQSSDNKDADEVPGKGDKGVSKGSRIDDQERTNSKTDIFDDVYDDREAGAEADTNNLKLSTDVSHIPTTRVHKDHPKEQIIGDLNLATQTRRMINFSKENAMMDVKSAFLYGTIEEEVHVSQTLGFEDPQFLDKVYKVEKALYGLHQALRAWYETLSTYLLENRFRIGNIDKTLFIKKDKGLQVKQKDDGIFISQDKYVAGILKKFDFTIVKTARTPIETNKALIKDAEAEDVDVHLYISMIGSLMYLIASRPDIMFAVCACARFQVTPKTSHLYGVKRIFRYLKG